MLASLLLLISLSTTVYTAEWTDDFQYDFLNANDGWRVYFEDDPLVDIGSTKDFTSTTSTKQYHGPFENGKFWMERNFQCGDWSQLEVTWSVAHCGADGTKDHSTFYFNSREINKNNLLSSPVIYTDSDLYSTYCPPGSSLYTETYSETEDIFYIGSMQAIFANLPFDIEIRQRTSASDEVSFIYDLKVECKDNNLTEPTRPPTADAPDTLDEYCMVDSTFTWTDLNGDYVELLNCSDSDCERIEIGGQKVLYREEDENFNETLYIYTVNRRHVISPNLGSTDEMEYYAKCRDTNVDFNIDPTGCNGKWRVRNENHPGRTRFRADNDMELEGDVCGYEPKGGVVISWSQILYDFTHGIAIYYCIAAVFIMVNTLCCCHWMCSRRNKKKKYNKVVGEWEVDEEEDDILYEQGVQKHLKFVDDL